MGIVLLLFGAFLLIDLHSAQQLPHTDGSAAGPVGVNTATVVTRDGAPCRSNPYPNTASYFTAVYPLATSSCVSEDDPTSALKFLYDNAPDSISNHTGGAPPHPSTTGFVPPPLGRPYIPSRSVDPCTYYINDYPPREWYWYNLINGIPSNTDIEVNHAKASGAEVLASIAQDRATWSPSDSKRGWHMFYAPGSGVFVNTGKTIAAENKIALLASLGITFESIATFTTGAGTPARYHPGFTDPSAAVPHYITNITRFVSATAASLGLPKLLDIAAYGRKENLPAGVTENDFYQINRLATAYDYDQLLVDAAQKAGYDTYQLTVQPQEYGGWAFEYVLTGLNQSAFSTWPQWWNYVISQSSTRNPCGGEFTSELGGIPHSTALVAREICTFDTALYYCQYCNISAMHGACRAPAHRAPSAGELRAALQDLFLPENVPQDLLGRLPQDTPTPAPSNALLSISDAATNPIPSSHPPQLPQNSNYAPDTTFALPKHASDGLSHVENPGVVASQALAPREGIPGRAFIGPPHEGSPDSHHEHAQGQNGASAEDGRQHYLAGNAPPAAAPQMALAAGMFDAILQDAEAELATQGPVAGDSLIPENRSPTVSPSGVNDMASVPPAPAPKSKRRNKKRKKAVPEALAPMAGGDTPRFQTGEQLFPGNSRVATPPEVATLPNGWAASQIPAPGPAPPSSLAQPSAMPEKRNPRFTRFYELVAAARASETFPPMHHAPAPQTTGGPTPGMPPDVLPTGEGAPTLLAPSPQGNLVTMPMPSSADLSLGAPTPQASAAPRVVEPQALLQHSATDTTSRAQSLGASVTAVPAETPGSLMTLPAAAITTLPNILPAASAAVTSGTPLAIPLTPLPSVTPTAPPMTIAQAPAATSLPSVTPSGPPMSVGDTTPVTSLPSATPTAPPITAGPAPAAAPIPSVTPTGPPVTVGDTRAAAASLGSVPAVGSIGAELAIPAATPTTQALALLGPTDPLTMGSTLAAPAAPAVPIPATPTTVPIPEATPNAGQMPATTPDFVTAVQAPTGFTAHATVLASTTLSVAQDISSGSAVHDVRKAGAHARSGSGSPGAGIQNSVSSTANPGHAGVTPMARKKKAVGTLEEAVETALAKLGRLAGKS